MTDGVPSPPWQTQATGFDSMKPIAQVLPGAWSDLAAAVKELRSKLYGAVPEIGPVDVGDIAVPPNELAAIRAKNLRVARNEITVDEMTADGSPYRTDAFFDDQLVEVLGSISDRYEPIDFIKQMITLIEVFLCESAAFRAAYVEARINSEHADLIVGLVQAAAEKAADDDTRKMLELLLVDLANGGDAPWAKGMSASAREYLARAMEEVA